MSKPVIQTFGLSKSYRAGRIRGRGYLRDSIMEFVHPSQKNTSSHAGEAKICALRNVDLCVDNGEVLGLIGRNGAGKTTLLKLLSRITRPSSGTAEIRGRIGSLLEVGTGFHGELSGRENTFLSGAILGMGKREIERKFDEIIAFAEIERFIDMPVKHYSSGMYVRLAFAVAAHLETEILLVDEVLAVGDVAFQRKCLGKMGDVSRTGRTILFVSHNMGAIGQLCQRCVLLEKGGVADDGPPARVIGEYLKSCAEGSGNGAKKWDRLGSGRVLLHTIEVVDTEGQRAASATMGKELRLRLAGKAAEAGTEFSFSVQFVTAAGVPAVYLYDQFRSFRADGNGQFLIEMRVPNLLLMPGLYYLHVWVGRPGMEHYDWVKNAVSFDVVQGDGVPVTMPLTHEQGLVYSPFEVDQLQ